MIQNQPHLMTQLRKDTKEEAGEAEGGGRRD